MRQIIASAVLSLLITVTCIAVYHHFYAPRIYTFDMRKYLQTLQKDYLNKRLSDRDVDARIKKLAERIKSETKKDKNAVVLLKEVVIGGHVKEIRP